ncbi:hypothetical protein LNP74_22670 [Klebsiella pneumoniae subsp. pneumoniae]|nr:hypothetical protein [Klebsiella pneumoniae subsp. pneumoniae]
MILRLLQTPLQQAFSCWSWKSRRSSGSAGSSSPGAASGGEPGTDEKG